MSILISRLHRVAALCATQSPAILDNELLATSFRLSSSSWMRAYSSDNKGDEPSPSEAPPSEAAAETTAVEPASEATPPATEATGPSIEELMARGYSKRQAAWLKPDPEKHKHFLPALSRKELGAFGDEGSATEFAEETELYATVPEVPLYNLREVVPEIMAPEIPLYHKLVALKEEFPDESLPQLAQRAGIQLPEIEAPPHPGAKRIIQWEAKLTMVVGVNEEHPADKKAKCKVHLRDLGEEAGVSYKGLQWIAEIAGPRYDANTGILTLTSEKYELREENRRDVLRMLNALVEEGKKMDATVQQQKASTA